MSALAFDPRAYLDTLRHGGDPVAAARAAGTAAPSMHVNNVVVLDELRAAMAARRDALRGIMNAPDVRADREAVKLVDG